jgi:transposase
MIQKGSVGIRLWSITIRQLHKGTGNNQNSIRDFNSQHIQSKNKNKNTKKKNKQKKKKKKKKNKPKKKKKKKKKKKRIRRRRKKERKKKETLEDEPQNACDRT